MAGLGVALFVDARAALDAAGLGVRILAVELAVGRVSDRGVRSRIDGLLRGVLTLLAEPGVLAFVLEVGVLPFGVAGADTVVVGVAGVLGESATVLATVAGDAVAVLSAPGDLAEPLEAWQSVQYLRVRGFEHPHAAQDQIPVFSVNPLPYESEFLLRRRNSRAVGCLLSSGVAISSSPLLVVGVPVESNKIMA